jgi:hypothetical protein
MTYLTRTEDQVRILAAEQGSVEVRDPQGRPVASRKLFDAADPEAIERHKRREGEQRESIPSEKVRAFMRKPRDLHDHGEVVDQAKVERILARKPGA